MFNFHKSGHKSDFYVHFYVDQSGFGGLMFAHTEVFLDDQNS